jgi:acetyltransferase-like isoleucine patch superfamily enzyme
MLLRFITKLFILLNFFKVYDLLMRSIVIAKLNNIKTIQGTSLNIIFQGGYRIDIVGDLKKFKIDKTSHLKSSCFIECTGGVSIGKYFHCGRGLTIFSTNHNFRNAQKIPYDDVILRQEVKIHDFVWIGANVTIVPGVTIGEGAVIGAGTVVNKDVEPFSVLVSSPNRIISVRDKEEYFRLKKQNKFQL